jgi:osomolarity two-component system, phosphorelay intermediate protein YPD1
MAKSGTEALQEAGEAIDLNTFEQILEMDDDEDEREFSRSIVYDFFQQAETTFKKMDTNL